MKILINCVTESTEPRGVERYILELVSAMADSHQNPDITILVGPWQKYFDRLSQKNVTVERLSFLKNTRLHRHLYSALVLPVKARSFDIVHLPNTSPILLKFYVPLVVTIHDLAEYFVDRKYSGTQKIYRKWMARRSAMSADKIITVSNYSARSISQVFGTDTKRLSTVYSGIEHFFPLVTHAMSKSQTMHEKKYVLYWGVVEHDKGIIETMDAMRHVWAAGYDVDVIVIGRRGNASEWLDMEYGGDGRVKIHGYMDDEQLASYIKAAEVVVFPSRYEGFGFPVLESFALNPNVITSKTTSLGEIGVGLAELVDPEDSESIAQSIIKLLQSPSKSSFEQRREKLKRFSWEKCAEETINAYKEAIDISG